MEIVEINKKINEAKMDMQSPYIKNPTESIDEVRKRIAKRAGSENIANYDHKTLYLKDDAHRIESDDVLKQKVFNLSKRVVGEEIKKFAEIASREISKELEEIEAKLELNMISSIDNMQNDIDKKIEKFNYNIKDLENRIRDLEILSMGTLNRVGDNKKSNDTSKISLPSEVEKEINTEKRDLIENDLNKNLEGEKRKGNMESKDVKMYYHAVEKREEEEKYINAKIKEISISFEKTGLLFRKNSYVSRIKDLKAEDFLNNKDDSDYKNIDPKDKEKIYNTIVALMDSLEIDPKEDESINEFLKRIYRVDFQNRQIN